MYILLSVAVFSSIVKVLQYLVGRPNVTSHHQHSLRSSHYWITHTSVDIDWVHGPSVHELWSMCLQSFDGQYLKLGSNWSCSSATMYRSTNCHLQIFIAPLSFTVFLSGSSVAISIARPMMVFLLHKDQPEFESCWMRTVLNRRTIYDFYRTLDLRALWCLKDQRAINFTDVWKSVQCRLESSFLCMWFATEDKCLPWKQNVSPETMRGASHTRLITVSDFRSKLSSHNRT